VADSGGQFATPASGAVAGVLLLVDGLGLGQRLFDSGREFLLLYDRPFVAALALTAGDDLGAVERNGSQLDEPHFLEQPQGLEEELA